MLLSSLFLLAYFVLILVVARGFSRRVRNLRDFFLAGRSLGAFPVALALAASWFGAASTLGSINAFHDEGLSGAWRLVIPSILSFGVITLFMAKPVARQTHLSQPEAVEAHYGRAGRLLLSVIILAATTVLIGSQLVAAGKVCQAVFGLDAAAATVLSAAAVVSYAIWGGYFTVVVTDIAQMTFVALGFSILLAFTLFQAVPGAAAWQAFIAGQPPQFWDWTHGWREHLFLVITFVLAWSIAPEMWQRMSSTRNPDLAFRAGWQASLLMLGLFAVIGGIGLLSTRLIGHHDAVLVALALKIPVRALSALVLLGFVAAVTSTMDSSLNVGSLTLTRDLYQGFLRPAATDRECIRVARLTTFLMILPALAVALYFQDIIKILWMSADIYACCMFFPVIGMLYLKHPGRLSGVLGMLFGGVTVCLSALIQNGVLPDPLLSLNLFRLNLFGVHWAWPGWPHSTLIGVGVSGIGYALGYFLSKRQAVRRDAPALSLSG
jgi:SSS family solute:Na+ symporter